MVNWAPIHVPMERSPWTWVYYIPYVIFIALDKSPFRGGRPSMFFRKFKAFKHAANFFPISLHFDASSEEYNDSKTAFLMGCHPHGVLSLSFITSIASDAFEWDRYFPKLNIRLCTLNWNLRIPILREILLWMGIISADKESISYCLNKGAGNLVALVVGGAEEAYYASENESQKIILDKRKGFVKIALQTGARLLPAYSFGEGSLYKLDDKDNAHFIVKKIRQFVKSVAGFTLPAFRGRGFFQYDYGIVPHRGDVRVVIGKPIGDGKKVENPTAEQIDKLHSEYKAELIRIFDKYKTDPKAKLEIAM